MSTQRPISTPMALDPAIHRAAAGHTSDQLAQYRAGASLGGPAGRPYTRRMPRQLPRCLLISPLLAVAACGYAPANPADTAKPTYQSDLAACQTSGDKEAHRLVMSRGGLFLTYPISLPIVQARQTRKCMDGKGYAANQ